MSEPTLTESAIERLHREMDAKDARIEELEADRAVLIDVLGQVHSDVSGNNWYPRDYSEAWTDDPDRLARLLGVEENREKP